jgi:hypothetical protein
MSAQGTAFLVAPAFFGVRRFKSAAEYVFNTRIAAARKAFLMSASRSGGTFNCMAGSQFSLSS